MSYQESTLSGQVALVTGAARGLGRSHALMLASHGADMALADICRTPPGAAYGMSSAFDLEKVAAEVRGLGSRALAIHCDVTDDRQVNDMVEQVRSDLGGLDILVNNAGLITVSSVAEMTEREWDLVVGVSLKGTFLCCKHSLAPMMRQRHGRIVNTGSVAAKAGIPLNAHYGAAKAGVHLFTQALAQEVGAYGINVNAVAPAGVNTAMMEGISPELGRLWNAKSEDAYRLFCEKFNASGRELTEADISRIVLWLCSEETKNLTGQIIYI